MKNWIELLRASVRPILALSACLGLLAMLFKGVVVPDAYWAYVGAITTFYFVQRAQEKRENGTSGEGPPPLPRG